MLCVLGMGGLTTGGVNFDAKVRRESFEPAGTSSTPTSAGWTPSPEA